MKQNAMHCGTFELVKCFFFKGRFRGKVPGDAG